MRRNNAPTDQFIYVSTTVSPDAVLTQLLAHPELTDRFIFEGQ